MKKSIIALLLFCIGCTHDPIEVSPPDTRLNWFNDAKFGMFIHWGVYSGMAGKYVGPSLYGTEYTEASPYLCGWGGEWILSRAGIPRDIYKQQADKFTASAFSGNEIASLAQETGMKYIIITIKHHFGYYFACMVNIRTIRFNIIFPSIQLGYLSQTTFLHPV
jgi:alpha-L-fucosidase